MEIIKWISEKEVHDTLVYYDNKQCKVVHTQIPIYRELPDKEFDMAIDVLIKELVDKNYTMEQIFNTYKELVEKNYIICGDTHQVLAIPVFDGNKYLELSQRRWGEIMADVANISKRYDKQFTYLDFYLAGYCKLQEVLPNEE